MSSEKAKWRGMVLTLTAAVLWGVSGGSGQFLMERRGVDAEWLVTVRMLGAGVLMLLLFSIRRGTALWSVWKNRRDAVRLILLGVFGMLAVQYTYFAAIRLSNAAAATILQFAAPVLIAIWLSLRRRRWPERREGAAIALAAAGMLLLVTHGRPDTLIIPAPAVFWGLSSAVALAFYSLYPAELLKKHSAALLTGWAMVIGGGVLSLARAPWRVTGVWDPPALLSLLFIIVLGTLVPFQFYMTAVRLTGAQTTSLLLSVEPLSAAAVSVLWLGVPFGLMDWAGTACILSTVFLLAGTRHPGKHAPGPAAVPPPAG